MKGLNKLALATAIAAVPFAAQAELKAMDDSTMGNVTGQAGVTIELETQVGIDAVTYTDEGTFTLSNVAIGGKDASAGQAGADGKLDNLKIDIDVAGDGDAIIHVGSTETDGNGNPVPIDFGVSVGSASLNSTDSSGDSTLLASNIGIEGDIAALDIQVDTATDNLLVDTAFNVTDMDMTVDFLGVEIQDMSITGASTFGNAHPSPGALGGQFAKASLTISKATGVNSTSGEGLSISVDDFLADVQVGATIIGGDSIGSIAMDNLAVTGTEMVVYGHQ